LTIYNVKTAINGSHAGVSEEQCSLPSTQKEERRHHVNHPPPPIPSPIDFPSYAKILSKHALDEHFNQILL